MKAIVLSCDKYHPLADLMMHTYQKLWPDHPFVFRVPYGNTYPAFLKEKYKEKIELIQTDYAKQAYTIETPDGIRRVSLIKPTVLALLADIHDDDWIYWCMDDRYLMKIDQKKALDIYKKVLDIEDKQILGVSMVRRTKERWYKKNACIKLLGGFKLLESIFTDSDRLIDMWGHQFVRCRLIRRMFESFPDRPFAGKELDSFPLRKLIGEKKYDVERMIATFGESTSCGELTINCFLAFKRWGLKVPAGFNVSSWRYQTTESFRLRGGRDTRVIARIIRWLKYKYMALLLKLYGVKR